MRRPPPPGRVSMAADSEQQRYLQSLQHRVSAGRRWTWWLAVAVAAALLVTVTGWFVHFASAVLSYAVLDPSIELVRSGADPERLTISYQPVTGGMVGFRRADAGRETELLDEVPAEATADKQTFEWRWSGVKRGDVVRVTFRRGWSVVTQELVVPEAPPVRPLGDAVLSGEIVDATSNRPVSGAGVKLVGTPLVARTGEDGRFRLPQAPAGPAGVEISAPKFSSEQLDVELVSGRETPVRVALSPGLKEGQIRLVLTWGKEPNDLDAHLEGPLPGEETFHVYFKEKGDLKSRQFVSLDVDAQNGRGPETITVLGVQAGTYHYFVHDYSNRDNLQNSALARSGAEVKLYQGGQARRFRANNESAGNIWHVCDIEIGTAGALVKKIDHYESKRLITRAMMADVVFLLDTGPNMQEIVEPMKSSCLEKAGAMVSAGLDCRFGVVPFGGAVRGPIPAVPLVDLPTLKARLAAPEDAKKPASSALEALQQALTMEFREGVEVFFILITGTPWDQPEQIAEAGRQVRERKIRVVVQANPGERDRYAPLYQEGGSFHSLAGDEPAQAEPKPGGGEIAAPDASTLIARWAFDPKKHDMSKFLTGKGLYGLRTAKDREKWIGRLGGTPESETAVAEGLSWLARHQATDGHWGPDCLAGGANSRCEDNSPCTQPGGPFEMAQTGLALLAFQAGGHYSFNDSKYSVAVKHGLDWLVKNQQKDGALVGTGSGRPVGLNALPRSGRRTSSRQRRPGGRYGPYYMYEHGIATFALCEACAVARAAGNTPDERYLAAAKDAVRFIEKQQHNDGGWRYTPNHNAGSDTSVSGWQVLALKTALEAGIHVDSQTLGKVKGFFGAMSDPSTGTTGYTTRGSGTDAMTGVGMLFQQFLLKEPDSPLVRAGAEILADRAETLAQADFYTVYNCTLAMYHAGNKPWERWNPVVRNAVVKRQRKDGCIRGSWDSRGPRGLSGGRVCETAWGVLSLEVYYRFAKEQKEAPAGKPEKPQQEIRP